MFLRDVGSGTTAENKNQPAKDGQTKEKTMKATTIVNIYEITCSEAYMMSEQGTGFSLVGWGNDTDRYKGNDDGGKNYVLPHGYALKSDIDGRPAIFDAQGGHCAIVMHSSGRPQLVSGSDKMPVLALAETLNSEPNREKTYESIRLHSP